MDDIPLGPGLNFPLGMQPINRALATRVQYRHDNATFVSFNGMHDYAKVPKGDGSKSSIIQNPRLPQLAAINAPYVALVGQSIDNGDRMASRLVIPDEVPFSMVEEGSEQCYALESKTLEPLIRLERYTEAIVEAVRSTTAINPHIITPVTPSFYEYQKPFNDHARLSRRVHSAAKALELWIAWAVYVASAVSNYHTIPLNSHKLTDAWPEWVRRGVERGMFTSDWLHDCLFSPSFDFQTKRVGTFLTLADCQFLDDIPFFLRAGVPFTVIHPDGMIGDGLLSNSRMSDEIKSALRFHSSGHPPKVTNLFDSAWINLDELISKQRELESRLYVHFLDFFIERAEKDKELNAICENDKQMANTRKQCLIQARGSLQKSQVPPGTEVHVWLVRKEGKYNFERRREEQRKNEFWRSCDNRVKVFHEHTKIWDICLPMERGLPKLTIRRPPSDDEDESDEDDEDKPIDRKTEVDVSSLHPYLFHKDYKSRLAEFVRKKEQDSLKSTSDIGRAPSLPPNPAASATSQRSQQTPHRPQAFNPSGSVRTRRVGDYSPPRQPRASNPQGKSGFLRPESVLRGRNLAPRRLEPQLPPHTPSYDNSMHTHSISSRTHISTLDRRPLSHRPPNVAPADPVWLSHPGAANSRSPEKSEGSHRRPSRQQSFPSEPELSPPQNVTSHHSSGRGNPQDVLLTSSLSPVSTASNRRSLRFNDVEAEKSSFSGENEVGGDSLSAQPGSVMEVDVPIIGVKGYKGSAANERVHSGETAMEGDSPGDNGFGGISLNAQPESVMEADPAITGVKGCNSSAANRSPRRRETFTDEVSSDVQVSSSMDVDQPERKEEGNCDLSRSVPIPSLPEVRKEVYSNAVHMLTTSPGNGNDSMGPQDLNCIATDSFTSQAPFEAERDVQIDFFPPHTAKPLESSDPNDAQASLQEKIIDPTKFEPFLDYIFNRYGFTYPPAGPPYPDDPNWTGHLSDSELRMIRMHVLDPDTPFNHPEGMTRDLFHFVTALAKDEAPKSSLCDLLRFNTRRIARVNAPVTVVSVNDVKGQMLYRLQAGDKEEDWTLYVEDASVALECLRRRFVSTRDIVAHFLSRGTPFMRAFQSLPSHSPFVCSEPTPFPDFCTPNTFAAWEKGARAFMQRQNSFLLLSSGGLLWRLALYLAGPLEVHSALKHLGVPLGSKSREIALGTHEEVLQEEEINIIIGKFQLPSDVANQGKVVSFWPSEGARQGSFLANMGCWTPYHEAWFEKRIRGLREGTRDALGQNEWRKALRTMRGAVRTTKQIRKLSVQFLAE
ncbi:hypothetical protein SCHPADRAFT_947558 [Schizopora paradoxa]|uniref:Uncharacterized protein n=1 Tax=Schizopora paradoxa TaxID=27342 RepID=A0A0H2R581_9AGAM|nr:hypothetical protein SCHPADRAFT_947558 [Schizopora paradoxa]